MACKKIFVMCDVCVTIVKKKKSTFHSYYSMLIMSLTLLKLRCYGFHISRYGVHISQINFQYYVMAGWIAGMFSCFSLLAFLCNGQNIAKYEMYWHFNN